jgi:hypothetical protein
MDLRAEYITIAVTVYGRRGFGRDAIRDGSNVCLVQQRVCRALDRRLERSDSATGRVCNC